MSSPRTKYVPKCSSKVSNKVSQIDGTQADQSENSGQNQDFKRGKKRGNVSEKNRCLLKVKLPKLSKAATKEDKTWRKWMTEPVAKTTVRRGGGEGAFNSSDRDTGSDTGSGGGENGNDEEKTKLAVLKNIAKLLEENQLIRQRLVTLRQANQSCAD